MARQFRDLIPEASGGMIKGRNIKGHDTMIRSISIAMAVLLALAGTARADDRIQGVITQAAKLCAEFENGTLAVGDDATTSVDLVIDGPPVVILDESKFSCSTAASLFCGTGGCNLHAFVGDHQATFFARGWQVTTVFGKPILVLALHGTACGSYGADVCFEALHWNGSRFLTVRPGL